MYQDTMLNASRQHNARGQTLMTLISTQAPLLVLSQASLLIGTARGHGTAPSFCLDVHPRSRFISHSDTPSPGSGRIVSTSCEAIRPVYGEKV